jgi:cytoskeleton protein RodZ
VASEIQDNAPAPSAPSGQVIGSLLRETRERLGHSLPAVATALRIRQPYLQAIELGRYHELPGSAYAVGFVRSYADYLGLDGNEIVRRFKQESGGEFSSRAELSFPSAVSEGSFPTGGMLFLGLVVAVIAYGVWYWSSRDTSVAESVPPLPDRLAALIHKPVGNGSEVVPVNPSASAPATQAPAPAAETAAVVPAQPANPATPHEDVVPPNEGDAADKAPVAAAVPAPVPVASPVVTPALPAPVQPEVIKGDAKNKGKKPETAAVTAAAPAPAEAPKDQAVSQTQALNQSAAQVAAADVAPVAKPSSGKVDQPVALPDATRVILKANEDCWIRIRDASGTIIHSGVLRKGTSFRVTPHPGQTLTAGNAAALTVLVDNRPLPPLGAQGEVKKGLSLDPEKIEKAVPAAAPSAAPASAAEAAPAKSPTE